MKLSALAAFTALLCLLAGCNSDRTGLEARVLALESQVQAATHARTELESEVEALKSEVEDLKTEVQEATDAASGAQDDVDAVKERLDNASISQ